MLLEFHRTALASTANSKAIWEFRWRVNLNLQIILQILAIKNVSLSLLTRTFPRGVVDIVYVSSCLFFMLQYL